MESSTRTSVSELRFPRILKIIEALTTRYIVVTAAASVVAILSCIVALLALHVFELSKISSFVDAIFKALAAVIGSLWTLNRYFTQRADSPHLRVDPEIRLIKGQLASDPCLLMFRIDLVNTSNVLIKGFQQFVQIDAVSACETGVQRTPIHRWPTEGWHEGGSIEPKSWAAVNDEISCPASTKVVRVFVGIVLQNGLEWTWHRTFDLSK